MKDIITVTESLHQKSPLDTLVRQSSRRAEHSPRLQSSTPTSPRGLGSHDRDLTSPLLHTSFRTSASTAMSTENSFRPGASTDRDIYWRNEDESIYSGRSDSPDYSSADDVPYVVDTVGDQSPTLPPSPTPSSPLTIDHDQQEWTSPRPDGTAQEDTSRQSQDTMRDTWRSSGSADAFTFQSYESPRKQVPTLVVSSPMSPIPKSSYYESSTSQPTSHSSPVSRDPSSTQYSALNFSRPIRPSTIHDEESKREVLDRNQAIRQMSPNANPVQQQHYQGGYSPHGNNSNTQSQQFYPQYSSTTTPPFPQCPLDLGQTSLGNSILSRSPSATAIVSNSLPLALNPHSSAVNPERNTVTSSLSGHIRLPTSPPSPRPPSRISLYSTYSFYQLEDRSRASSPLSAQDAPNSKPSPDDATTVTTHSPSPPPLPFSESGISPDEYLSLGIKHHEANRLAESAVCFERAATIDGGCGVGMLMWGLSLRHAWGIAKDEKAAFWWLRRAAEAAVGDLEEAREGVHQKAVKSELVLAIYEVGQCFYHGWGVAQDKKMAVSYFQVAARLGDGDAQQELGYCLANGKGCKKDLKEAAKWYRAAAAQGASTIGLTWIYKPKYA